MSRAPEKITAAQRRLLDRLLALPGSSCAIETIERSHPHHGPRWRGHFYMPPCETCRHAVRSPANWRVIFSLVEAGLLKPQLPGSDYYTAAGITAVGHLALGRSPTEGVTTAAPPSLPALKTGPTP